MNSPGQINKYTNLIARTFGVKRRAIHNGGYYLISLPELLMRSPPQLVQSCGIVQCNQKRVVLRPGARLENNKELRHFSGALKYNEDRKTLSRNTNHHNRLSITSVQHRSTAAFTTHGEGDVDMDSREFIQNLETYSKYQPCPVSIGN